MFRKKPTSLFALAVGSFVAGPGAHATLSWTATVGGGPTGTSYANFDHLALGTAGGNSDGIAVTFTSGGDAVQGALIDEYAPPDLSNSDGALFFDVGNGPDATTYLSTELGSVTLSFPGPELYVGLLWGSVDPYNTLSLYNGPTLVGSITGTQVTPTADGDQGANGTYYVNINSSRPFNQLVATSSGISFEFDDVSYYSRPQLIAEPMTLAVLGAGLIGLGFARGRGISW